MWRTCLYNFYYQWPSIKRCSPLQWILDVVQSLFNTTPYFPTFFLQLTLAATTKCVYTLTVGVLGRPATIPPTCPPSWPQTTTKTATHRRTEDQKNRENQPFTPTPQDKPISPKKSVAKPATANKAHNPRC